MDTHHTDYKQESGVDYSNSGENSQEASFCGKKEVCENNINNSGDNYGQEQGNSKIYSLKFMGCF